MTQHTAQLVQAKKLIDSGKTAEAQQLIIRVLKENDQNANAWVLAAMATADEAQKRQALDKALKIDPAHPMAQQLYKRYALPPSVTHGVPVKRKPRDLSEMYAWQSQQKGSGPLTKLLGYFLTALFIVVVVALRFYLRYG